MRYFIPKFFIKITSLFFLAGDGSRRRVLAAANSERQLHDYWWKHLAERFSAIAQLQRLEQFQQQSARRCWNKRHRLVFADFDSELAQQPKLDHDRDPEFCSSRPKRPQRQPQSQLQRGSPPPGEHQAQERALQRGSRLQTGSILAPAELRLTSCF